MAVLLVVASFLAMEGVSYSLHRWVMHRIGMRWHASHHRPPQSTWEPNDLFPAVFSIIGIVTFALASTGPSVTALWWVGLGVTLYGAAYLFVHDVYIHHRLPIRLPRWRYFEWLRRSHRIHHVTGAEPYGMLLPMVSEATRNQMAQSDQVGQSALRDDADDVLDRRLISR